MNSIAMLKFLLQGRQSVFSSKRDGDKWQAPTGRGSGGQGGAPQNVHMCALKLQENPLFEHQSAPYIKKDRLSIL